MSATAECRNCDMIEAERPTWGDGPWVGEPNRAEWEHAGLPCIAHRGGGGAWCGYVGVPPGHPAHGKHYNDVPVSVHWGLTYSEPCCGHVCHVPKPGEPDNVWWLGFDCSHCDDLRPGDRASYERIGIAMEGHYWTLAEVQAETNSLAEQLAAMK